MKLSREKVLPIIMNALREDIGSGDITSALIFEKDIIVVANIISKEDCVLAGIDVAKWIFNVVDEKIYFRSFSKDGDNIKRDKKMASLKGSAKGILAGERTALNFLGRLSGIATLTNKFVEEVRGTKVEIFDTRKTTPGLRELEKYAVKVGGGKNHRMGLWDGVLMKDNHINGSRLKAPGSRLKAIQEVIKKTKSKGYKNIEIEVEDLKEFKVALESGADIIMLDNMKIGDIKKTVKLTGSKLKALGSKPVLEVSGGINLEKVKAFAKTGVDRISVGSLTHSAPSIDFSIEICT
jgi:nicotinate-nucleotide pyrophosphorylase (carboxylating)